MTYESYITWNTIYQIHFLGLKKVNRQTEIPSS